MDSSSAGPVSSFSVVSAGFLRGAADACLTPGLTAVDVDISVQAPADIGRRLTDNKPLRSITS